ncbi:uncharacterized protein LOC134740221 isoform X2 [Pongo pygmaeus]|uniref:uncharacterized protein LOC134740221 isoform X2 n=1 Tax=Pongo pygmaeus TaxID=9600 RepID=UPI00300D4E09
MHTATFTIPYPHFAETPAKTLPMQDSATTEPQSVTSRGHVDNHRRNQRDPTFCCCQVLRKCTHPHERDINRHRASASDLFSKEETIKAFQVPGRRNGAQASPPLMRAQEDSFSV